MDWAAAMQLCENMGKGLVKWDTADKYLDMKHLTSQAGYWTALTNINGNGCNSAYVCDNLLVLSDRVSHWANVIFFSALLHKPRSAAGHIVKQ